MRPKVARSTARFLLPNLSGDACLIMQMALLVFNVLRVMGQATLNDPTVPLRTPQHRRRLATVTKHLVQCAVKLVRHGRTLAWRYSLNNPWGPAIARLYDLFASP